MLAERAARGREMSAASRLAIVAIESWERLALGAILLLSAILELWRIGADGYPNMYYAAGVRSMLTGWHPFLFNSFDPAGFVTVDKPPLGFWLQTLSAWIFGFSTWSVLLPEAIAGVFSVLVLYHLVARVFGVPAGLLAALALAVTPINAVTDRSNVVDGLLVLTVLLAAWAVAYATETGQLRWLILGAALVGLGFNIKMLEAYLVVPALGSMYLFGATGSWKTRLWHALAGAVVLIVISLSWVTLVDLTPASQRPYVGSDPQNSALDLALGYNGLQRLNGRAGPVFGSRPPGAPAPASRATLGGFTAGENGSPGPLRLLNGQIGAQVSWLLPIALFGLIAAAAATRPRWPLDRKQRNLLLWGMWGLTQYVFFSRAQFFHVYYMVMLTPAFAALFGIGVVALWQWYRKRGAMALLLPLSLAISGAVQLYIVHITPNSYGYLAPLIVILIALAAAVLLVVLGPGLAGRVRVPTAPTVLLAAAIGALVLLLAPTVFSVDAVASNRGHFPTAAPAGGGARTGGAPADFFRRFRQRGAGGPGRDAQTADPKLVQFLESHRGGATYLVAGLSSMEIAPIIVATGQPAVALGGFSGSDRIIPAQQLAAMVHSGQLRYFLGQGGGDFGGRFSEPGRSSRRFGGFGRGANGDLTAWVQKACTAVPATEWQSGLQSAPRSPVGGNLPPSNGPPPATRGFGRGGQLFSCR